MLRYFYKISFLPKIPQAHAVSDAPYSFQGNFFLISEKLYSFIDFQIKNDPLLPNENVHIASPIQTYLSESQLTEVTKLYQISTQFYNRFSKTQFDEYKIMIIPAVSVSGKPEIESTLQWANDFKNSIPLQDIYLDLLRKHDRKNDGQKLKSSFFENGEKVERFIRFILSIDYPSIEDFIQNVPANDNQEITKQELVLFLVSLKFQEKIFERLIWSKLQNVYSASGRSYYQYFLGSTVCFSSHSDQNMPKEKEITYAEYYDKKNKLKNLDLSLPLLETIPIRTRFPSEKEIFTEYTKYPQAFSQSHKIISDILANHKLIPLICQRIPPDFEINSQKDDQSISTKIPFEALHTRYFPIFAGALIYQLNHIITQLKPISTGVGNIEEITKLAAQKIEEVMNYKFKNLSYLCTALIDPSYPARNNNIHSYQRLEYLGDCVLDVTTTFAIFNANEKAVESEMTYLKHSMVSNRTFASLSTAIGLTNYVITHNKTLYTDRSKSSADIFESVFGAIFRDSNLSTCFLIYKNVVTKFVKIFNRAVKRFKYGNDTIRYIINSTPETFCKLNVNVDRDFFNTKMCLEREKIHQYLDLESNGISPTDKRINRQIFTLAFTHSSFSQTQGNCYERLEFIGDIIVKLVVGVVLYFSFPTSNDSGLSIASSHYKSNDTLGRASLKLGLQNLLLAGDSTENSIFLNSESATDVSVAINKIYGDLFESSTAAMAFCFGLNEAFKYVQKRVLGGHIENRPDNPEVDPISHVIIMFQKYFKVHPDFHIWEHRNNLISYISIKDVQLPFIGEATEKNKAMQNVSRMLLEEYNSNPTYFNEIEQEIHDKEDENSDKKQSSSFELICKDDL